MDLIHGHDRKKYNLPTSAPKALIHMRNSGYDLIVSERFAKDQGQRAFGVMDTVAYDEHLIIMQVIFAREKDQEECAFHAIDTPMVFDQRADYLGTCRKYMLAHSLLEQDEVSVEESFSGHMVRSFDPFTREKMDSIPIPGMCITMIGKAGAGKSSACNNPFDQALSLGISLPSYLCPVDPPWLCDLEESAFCVKDQGERAFRMIDTPGFFYQWAVDLEEEPDSIHYPDGYCAHIIVMASREITLQEAFASVVIPILHHGYNVLVTAIDARERETSSSNETDERNLCEVKYMLEAVVIMNEPFERRHSLLEQDEVSVEERISFMEDIRFQLCRVLIMLILALLVQDGLNRMASWNVDCLLRDASVSG